MPISRRAFCGYALTSGMAGAFPAEVLLAQGFQPSNEIPASIPAFTMAGEETAIEGAAVRELGESLQGSLILRGDFGYDGARRLWNGMHDRYPALVVRAAVPQDVANAVTFARERELLLAVKGGGHSWPGRSVEDGALMIDLGAMNDVLVDAADRRASVGGGAWIYNLDFATQKHGLATTAGVVSHTGMGGLTLGGGFGYLNRKFGLTIDNLLSAQVVTADGQIRYVGPDENEALFWAIRGGGGNFGVVTAFEYQLHEVGPEVLGGDILWPIDQARDVLEFYAEYSAGLSDEMYVGPFMTTAADGTGLVGMEVCYCDDMASGERELAPLRELGDPISDTVAAMPYVALQTKYDAAFRPGVRSYVKSGMAGEFTPELIEAMIGNFQPGAGVELASHAAGGAVARIAETDTAWPHRNAAIMVVPVSVWTDPAEDDERIEATRNLWSALEPHTGGYYDNIQSEVSDSASNNYGPVYERLVSVKNEVDPMNLFRLNSNNIRPTV